MNFVAPDNDGDTLLHIASRYNYIEIVRLLLSHQADRTIVNDDGHTALDVATTDQMRALLV